MSTIETSLRSKPWLALLGLLALLAWAYWPVTAGDFVIDDYIFLATSRLVDSPWSAFWTSHYYEPYSFRPAGLVSWWYASQLFGLDYFPHSLINLGIHAVCVLLLVNVLAALGLPRRAQVLGGAMLALGPVMLATLQWPSDRFDALALLFILLTVRLLLFLATRPEPGTAQRLAFGAMLLAAALACFSKELAFPVIGTLALMALVSRYVHEDGLPPSRGAALLAVVLTCFAWRLQLVPNAYPVIGSDLLAVGTSGLLAWSQSFVRYSDLAMGGSRGVWLMALLGLLWLVAVVWAVLQREGEPGRRRLLLASLLLIPGGMVAQLSLAGPFSFMLNGEPLGTLTYARFYFMPWAVASIVFAVALAGMPRQPARVLAGTAVAMLVLASAWQRPLGAEFARWSSGEIRALSIAAADVFDREPAAAQDCAAVFLGSQSVDPPAWFARFADVTVKARSENLDRIAHCHTLTEMTPYIFVLPAHSQTASMDVQGLRPIFNPDGSQKPDSVWSGVRYRYRLPPADWTEVPSLRYYEWRGGRFLDITDTVRSGQRKVPTQGWGF